MKLTWFGVFAILFVACTFVTAFAGLRYMVQGNMCESRWEKSGMTSHYEWWSGCVVETASGVIPEENVRATIRERSDSK